MEPLKPHGTPWNPQRNPKNPGALGTWHSALGTWHLALSDLSKEAYADNLAKIASKLSIL